MRLQCASRLPASGIHRTADLVTQVADRGYVLEVGKVVLEGTMKEIINNEIVQRAFL